MEFLHEVYDKYRLIHDLFHQPGSHPEVSYISTKSQFILPSIDMSWKDYSYHLKGITVLYLKSVLLSQVELTCRHEFSLHNNFNNKFNVSLQINILTQFQTW
jgi:hypothetical protein